MHTGVAIRKRAFCVLRGAAGAGNVARTEGGSEMSTSIIHVSVVALKIAATFFQLLIGTSILLTLWPDAETDDVLRSPSRAVLTSLFITCLLIAAVWA